MAGRRRTYQGLKAFADTIEPFVKAKVERDSRRKNVEFELELKRKYAQEDFDRRLKQAGILRGISKGTVNPLTLESQTPPPAAPKPLSPGDQATQQKLDLVKRLQSTDAEERRQAVEQLKAFQSGGFISSDALISDPTGGGGSGGPRPGLFQQATGLIGKAANRVFGYQPPGISGPVNTPQSVSPINSISDGTSRINQSRIDQVLKEAEDAIRRGADPEAVKKRVQQILGY